MKNNLFIPINKRTRNKFVLVFFVAMLLNAGAHLHAQLKGDHILGLNGLDAGTQAPAGINLLVPVYVYNAAKLKNDKGEVISSNLNINSLVTGVGAAWVLNVKLLGANIGGSVLFPFVTNKIESNQANVKTAIAYSDTYVQPLQLGWHTNRADFVASYQMYIPTGRWENGGTDNAGLGIFANEFSAGTTLKMGKKKSFHISSILSYEINSKKKDSEIKTGDLVSIEGGIGKTWYKKSKGPIPTIISAGMIYYMQYKVTSDHIPVNGSSITGNRDQVYGLGAEGSIFIPSLRSSFILRWAGELGARNRFEGNTYLFIWGFNIKSFHNKEHRS
jgi:hypothetical protein